MQNDHCVCYSSYVVEAVENNIICPCTHIDSALHKLPVRISNACVFFTVAPSASTAASRCCHLTMLAIEPEVYGNRCCGDINSVLPCSDEWSLRITIIIQYTQLYKVYVMWQSPSSSRDNILYSSATITDGYTVISITNSLKIIIFYINILRDRFCIIVLNNFGCRLSSSVTWQL